MRLHALVVLGFEGAVNLVAQFIENVTGGAGDGRIFKMSWAGQFDRELALDAAGTEGQKNDAIAEANRFANVVGHENDGASGLAPDALQLVVQQVTSLGVEGGERFVHQQNVGFGGQSAGDGHALPHAARELVDVALFKLRQMNEAQVIACLLLALGLGDAFHLHSEFDVLADRQPGEQAVLLEDEDAVGARTFDRLAVDQNLAGGLRLQPGDQMQQRGLAATRGADDADELSSLHLQVDVVESQQALAALRAIAQADFAEADLGNSGGDIAHRTVDRDRTHLAAGSARVSCEAWVDRDRELAGKFLDVGTH